MSQKSKNLLLIFLVLIMALVPYLLLDGEFVGTDDKALVVIEEVRPDYQPWIGHFWETPEDLELPLFILQGSIGIGFFLYYFWSKKKRQALT